jgi:hypothetical protein
MHFLLNGNVKVAFVARPFRFNLKIIARNHPQYAKTHGLSVRNNVLFVGVEKRLNINKIVFKTFRSFVTCLLKHSAFKIFYSQKD